MAYSTNQVGLGSYINPADLLLDEVQYELLLRGFDMSRTSVEEQRRVLRRLQLDEILSPKIIRSNKTIADELTVIQVKLITIRQAFELEGSRQHLISRLRHLRLRVLRLNAIDDEQVKMKEEVIEEIEFLFESFGAPEDRTPIMRPVTSDHSSSPYRLGRVPRNPEYEFPPPPNIPRSSGVPPQPAPRTSLANRAPVPEPRPEPSRHTPLLNRSQMQNQSANPRVEDFEPVENEVNPIVEEDRMSMSSQERDPVIEEVSPETPTIGDNTRLRADVSIVVENVLANQLERMMLRITEGMQEFQRRNQNHPFGNRQSEEFNRHPEPNRENWNPPQPHRRSQQASSNPLPPAREETQPRGLAENRQWNPQQNQENRERYQERPRYQGRERSQPLHDERPGNRHREDRPLTPSPVRERNDRRPQPVPEVPRIGLRNQPRLSGNSYLEDRNFNNRIPINKWPIKFSGEPKGMSVEEFLKRVEVLARNNQISEMELLSKANFLFRPESAAEVWYYTFSHKFNSWEMLKHQLRLRFEVPNKDKVVEREIRERKQMSNETFVTFMGEIERLCQQLSKPMTERMKLSILMENMRDWYRPHLAFVNTENLDTEALCALCYELDKSVYRSYAPRSRPYNVHCIDDPDVEEQLERDEPEINAINRGKVRKPTISEGQKEVSSEQNRASPIPILCWNCRQIGHYWRDCTRNKQLFCHICGQPDVVAMSCPNNHRCAQTGQKNE